MSAARRLSFDDIATIRRALKAAYDLLDGYEDAADVQPQPKVARVSELDRAAARRALERLRVRTGSR